jgi:hypothetical protein
MITPEKLADGFAARYQTGSEPIRADSKQVIPLGRGLFIHRFDFFDRDTGIDGVPFQM